MSWQVFIMGAVASVLCMVGAACLLALFRPNPPARVYVLRLVGIMALAAGVVLAFSASSMWRWSAGP